MDEATIDKAPAGQVVDAKDSVNLESLVSHQRLEEEGLEYYVLSGRVMAENILWFIAFIQERILAYNTNATGMKDQPSALGERKRMQRRDLDLELLFIKHSMANAVQDVLDAFEYRVLS